MPSVKTRHLDDLDRALLNRVQLSFPIDGSPFRALAEALDTDEGTVIARLEDLKRDRIIRQISMIFDTRALGYRSSLVASASHPGTLDAAADVVSAHPGVSHNYRRDHEFDLWWTIAVPPYSSLEAHVDRVHELAGFRATRLMPTIRMFKIGVDLDMTGKRPMDARTTLPAYRAPASAGERLTPREIAVLREVQEDIALEPQPYHGMAARAGIEPDELLGIARGFIEQGRARRFAAVLHHRQAGFVANAMSVWKVPEDRIEEVGYAMAGFAAVSHCYQRPTYPEWPYNLFGMLHGRTKADCEAAADAIAERTGIAEHAMLYSTKEYKKVRVRYYTDEFDAWEAQHLAGRA